MHWYVQKNKARKGKPGDRPAVFWKELEAAGHTRRKIGTTKWKGPVRPDDGDRMIVEDKLESDYQFLKRLNLLRGWEKRHIE